VRNAAVISVAALAALAALAAVPRDASAGRRHLAWSYGTEVLPERGYEIESWIESELGKGDVDLDETRLGWALSIGITDQLELRLPAQVAWQKAEADPTARTTIDRYGVEARWRLVSSDPVDAPALVPLIRFAALHQASEREAGRFELDAVVSYTTGRIFVLADLGAVATIRRGDDTYAIHPGGGVSVIVTGDVRLGAEAHAQLTARGAGIDWMTAGPTLAWTHGRGWLTVNAGIGVFGISAAPRIDWGVAF
jgi:hypothetical protein